MQIEFFTAEGPAPAIRAQLPYAMGNTLQLWELEGGIWQVVDADLTNDEIICQTRNRGLALDYLAAVVFDEIAKIDRLVAAMQAEFV